MTNHLVEYCKTIDWSTLEEGLEELKQFDERLRLLSETEKGLFIGQLIGKYGVEYIGGGLAAKALKTFRDLRNANRLCNLEALILSEADKEAIWSASARHAAWREVYLDNLVIEWDRQFKHFPGKHNFDPLKGEIGIEIKKLENLIHKYKGEGIKSGHVPFGEAGHKELVNFNEFIGFYKNEDGTIILPTTMGILHYSRKGLHVVPAYPKLKK